MTQEKLDFYADQYNIAQSVVSEIYNLGWTARAARERELQELIREKLPHLASMIARKCGNCEGTPCDDRNHSYICSDHAWLAKLRAALSETQPEEKTK